MNKPIRNLIIILPLLGLIIIAIVFALTAPSKSPQIPDTSASNVNPAISQISLNKQFQFPIFDSQRTEVTRVNFEILNAEKTTQIILGGQKASSISGKQFLIINLKITNSFSKNVSLNSRDYIRLMINNNSELIAPEIHNDPVDILAISTKYTRVGFTINETDKNLTLSVGEITQNKTSLPLQFN